MSRWVRHIIPLVCVVWAAACATQAQVMEPAVPRTESAVALTTPGTNTSTPQLGWGGRNEEEPEPLRSTSPPVVSEPAFPQPLDQLGPFYSALGALSDQSRKRSVRVMWMGDSHTAADFMTDEVRQALQRSSLAGGPGFVRLGMAGYRHGEVRVTVAGRWRTVPILPAQRTRVLDGVFGYGGVRTVPYSGASVRVKASNKYTGNLRWTLVYRLPPQSALAVGIGQSSEVLKPNSSAADANGVLHHTVTVPVDQELVVRHHAGSPEVFGVFAETEVPGLVFDTVGINGARAATALAWEPQQFIEAVRDRQIDLLVLAYGTNEIFDQGDPSRYQEHIEEVVERVRTAVPGVPCWIVGPPDAATDDGRSRIRVPEVTLAHEKAALSLGCAFTSSFSLMGGEQSFARWMSARPPLARADHIHLTIMGYKELGQRLAQQLLGEVGAVGPSGG